MSTCAGSRRRRRRIAVTLALAGVGAWALRSRGLTWGTSAQERTATLPGDGAVPLADLVATRAISVAADAQAVWPWLAQLGQGRGGFYSYDAIENLAGCDVHSADRIVPEWQDPRVGDAFRLHPEVELRVLVVEPGRALVVGGVEPASPTAQRPPYDFSWAFVLRPAADGSTRLVVRERYGYRAPWAALVVEPVAWVSFVMTERMLRGIRDRAQARRPVRPATTG